jgi:hypothetical protein
MSIVHNLSACRRRSLTPLRDVLTDDVPLVDGPLAGKVVRGQWIFSPCNTILVASYGSHAPTLHEYAVRPAVDSLRYLWVGRWAIQGGCPYVTLCQNCRRAVNRDRIAHGFGMSLCDVCWWDWPAIACDRRLRGDA